MLFVIEWLNDRLFGVVVPPFLLLVGAFLALRLRGPFLLTRKKNKNGRRAGGKSALRALSMALAGTLGVGNISGVALAISLGGAGAVFWMWVSALAAMMLKYAEVFLAVRYRQRDGGGAPFGGAMYYIRYGIGGRVGRALAVVFALFCLATAGGLGSLLQANAVAECMQGMFYVPTVVSGLLLALFTALVVLGGAKKISALTERLIPLLTLLYLAVALWAIGRHAHLLPSVFSRIFSSALRVSAFGGGLLGFLTSRALRFGVARGLLSNEAGCGTATMAHATANSTPHTQGLIGVLEVAVDTLLLCTVTAVVVLMAYPTVPTVGGGVTIALAAFGLLAGKGAPYLVTVALVFFAYATVICWAYYGESALRYLTAGLKARGRERARRAYFAVFCGCLVLGACFSSDAVFGLTDILLSLMTLLNGSVLCLLSGEIAAEKRAARGGGSAKRRSSSHLSKAPQTSPEPSKQ